MRGQASVIQKRTETKKRQQFEIIWFGLWSMTKRAHWPWISVSATKSLSLKSSVEQEHENPSMAQKP